VALGRWSSVGTGDVCPQEPAEELDNVDPGDAWPQEGDGVDLGDAWPQEGDGVDLGDGWPRGLHREPQQ
jgi:hypothetical protein